MNNKNLDLFVVKKNKLNKRPIQIGKEIKSIIDNLLVKGKVKDIILLDKTIIISEVKVSSDLSTAKVYVYLLAAKLSFENDDSKENEFTNESKLIDQVVNSLNKHSSFFKKCIGNELHIKVVPNLTFIKDDHFDKIDEINAMFKKLPKYYDNE